MADVLYRHERFAEAERLYREGIKVRKTRLKPNDEDVLDSTTSLGRLLSDWAWEDSTNDIASIDRAREGAGILRDGLAIRLRGTNATHWRTAGMQSCLGGALLAVAVTDPSLSASVQESKFTEAESLLLQSQSALQKNSQAESINRRDALLRLVRLCTAWEKAEPLAEWKQRLNTFDRITAREETEIGVAYINDWITRPFRLRRDAVIHRYFEEWANHGNAAVADEFIATNLVLRNLPAVLRSLEDYKTGMVKFHAAFPDARFTVEEQISEGDKVVVRWTLRATQATDYQGHAPKGKTMTLMGISIFRLAERKIQDISVSTNRFDPLEQLGPQVAK